VPEEALQVRDRTQQVKRVNAEDVERRVGPRFTPGEPHPAHRASFSRGCAPVLTQSGTFGWTVTEIKIAASQPGSIKRLPDLREGA